MALWLQRHGGALFAPCSRVLDVQLSPQSHVATWRRGVVATEPCGPNAWTKNRLDSEGRSL